MDRRIYTYISEIAKESVVAGVKDFVKSFKSVKAYLVGSCGAFYATKDKLFKDLNDFSSNFMSDSLVLKALLFLFIFLILLFLFYQIKQFCLYSWRKYILIKRESVYGNAIVLLSQAYANIHSNRYKELETTEVKTILVDFCDKIRDIYEFKTKSKCSVSIKIMINLPESDSSISYDTQVVNLVRDSSCLNRYTNEYERVKHNIANNTCFQRIVAKFFSNKYNEMFFLSNDIPSIDDYDNSSFQLYPKYTDNLTKTEKSRRKHYPLEYRSELVVSLAPLKIEEKINFPILGFLCVDCQLENQQVFDSKYDIPLMQGVADGLYDFIKKNLSNKKVS